MPVSKKKLPSTPKPAAESFDALRRRESVRDGLVRVARRHANTALDRIEHPKKADRTDDIHQVRVYCKRLRALLRLLKPVTDVEAVKRENIRIREASRSLSAFRDAFVAGETLKRVFEDAAPRHMRDAARLLGVKHRAPKSKQNLDVVLKEVAKTLRRTADEFRQLPISIRGWAALAPGLEQSYHQARKEYRRCEDRGASHLGDCFHSWRKRVKDLGYQLELFENLDNDDLQRLRKDVRRLGTLLGEDHDYLIFAEQVRAREKQYVDLANFRPVRKRLRRRLKILRAREFAIAQHLFADKSRNWITHLSGWWRVWKNPDASNVVLTIEQPISPVTNPKSVGTQLLTQLENLPVTQKT